MGTLVSAVAVQHETWVNTGHAKNLENAFIDSKRRWANKRLHKQEFYSFSCETPPAYETENREY